MKDKDKKKYIKEVVDELEKSGHWDDQKEAEEFWKEDEAQDRKDDRINEIHSELLKMFNDIEICIDELKSLGNHSLNGGNALLNTRDWLQQLSKR